MNITTTYTLTPDEALRGTRTFKRLWYTVSVTAGAALILFGFYSLLASRSERGIASILVINGLIFFVLPEAVLRWARLRRGSQPYSPMEVTLDDEGLTLSTESNEGGLPWSAFQSVLRREGFWIFQISPSQAVFVPERALEPSASSELERFFRGRNQLK